MYLPRSIYELLPYGYVVTGLLLCLGSYVRSDAPWSNAAFGIGAVGIVAGFVIILRRRSFRVDAARYDPHSLDD